MAGKRQHVIPQFLQEGFATRNAQGKAHTWVFRRDTPPFKSNILNIGVEGRFYTYEGDNEVDDLITVAESEFSTLLRALRDGTVSSLSNPMLSKLITHFEARTRHLRENLIHTVNIIASELLDFMSDEDKFAAWLIEKVRDDPAIMRELCARELSDRQLPPFLLEAFIKLATSYAPSFIRLHKSEFRGLANALRPRLTESLEKKVKSAHIRALKESIAPQAKINMLSNLSYAVHNFGTSSLILGDSVVVFCVDGDRSYKTFLEKKTG